MAAVPPVAPVLLDVVRDGWVESQHRGSVVLLDATGDVVVAAGDVTGPVFPRSSLKPLQAVAMLASGYPGRDAALALAAASHSGEDVHIAGARAILAAAGVSETALQCPSSLPSHEASASSWLRDGHPPARVCHNCSGKHSAMLSTCVAAGWPIATYRDPAHPLQLAARDAVSQLCGEPVAGVAVDGCGAPAFAVSLTGLARAFVALAGGEGLPGLVGAAMRAHPRLIGGTGRAVTELTAAVPGLVCKEGAEGVWAAALPDGRAFAAKIADGSARALPPLLGAVLGSWDVDGADVEVVRRWSSDPVLGGGEPVGAITASAGLRALLTSR